MEIKNYLDTETGKKIRFEVYSRFLECPPDVEEEQVWFECAICGCGVHRDNIVNDEGYITCSDIKCLKIKDTK